MTDRTNSTGITEADPPVPPETGEIITVEDITRLQNRGTLGMTDLLAMMETSHISTESIQDNTEEVLLRIEMISRNMNTGGDLRTGNTHLAATGVMLLQTEVMAGGDLHLTQEIAEVTSTTEMTGLTTSGNNLEALTTGNTMTTEETGRARELKEEGQLTIKERTRESLQKGMIVLKTAKDHLQKMKEKKTQNAEDVEELATEQKDVNSMLFGVEDPASVDYFTEEENATFLEADS